MWIKNACFRSTKLEKIPASNSQRRDSSVIKRAPSTEVWTQSCEVKSRIPSAPFDMALPNGWDMEMELHAFGSMVDVKDAFYAIAKPQWASRKVPLRCGCLQIALDGSCLSNWTSSITSATCKKHATETVYILLMLQDSHSIDNVCSYQAFVVTIDSHWSVSLLADLRRPQKRHFQRRWRTSCWNLALV